MSWSASYRGRAGYVSDSDSDSDSDNAVAEPDTNDAFREMDLSGRHETVDYRPNPWSIARINAASRPSLPKPSLARTSTPARSPPKPQLKPIVEAFKKQAKRGPLPDVIHDSISVPGAKRGASSASNSRQGQSSALQVVPRRTQPLDLPPPTHKPQTGSTIQQKSAHIPNVSGQFIQPAHAPPPFKPSRRTFGTHRATNSSPVRLLAPVGDHPTFRHSSPGSRSHAPVSGKILSNPGTW